MEGEKASATPDTAAEISCRSFGQLLLYFERRYGGDGDALLQEVGALDRRYLLDTNNFTSLDYAQRLTDALVRASGDPSFMRQAGLASTTPEHFGFVYYLVKAVGTPRLTLSKVVDVVAGLNRVGALSVEELRSDYARLRYQSSKPEQNRNLCEGRIGQFASLTTIFDLPPAQASELECQVEGAPACRYEFRWQQPVYPRVALIPGLFGFAGGALLHQLGYTGAWLFPLLGLVSGTGAALAWLYRQRLKRRERQLETQYQSLVHSMHDLERRHVEISSLNETLEARVVERTQELEDARANLQVALDKRLELDRLKTQFFQNISHELRTPLTLILAPLDSLGYETELPLRARQQIDIARRSALRLLALINELLALSSLESGRMKLSLEEAEPVSHLKQLIEHSLPLASQRGIELSYEGPPRLPPLPLDIDKFEKCVLNLISNALKFTGIQPSKPARVTLSARIHDGSLFVSVSDTGIGIPAHEQPQIFDRFHQVDGSDERQFGGTGIGLSLVRELIQLHRGSVSLHSVPGEGSTFTLQLPASLSAYPPDQHISPSRALPRAASPQTLPFEQLSEPTHHGSDDDERPLILIADDSPDMLAFLSSVLQREHRIIGADDGEKAWNLALLHRPHLIISDVMMPKMNGHALARALKDEPRTQEIPLILLTAQNEGWQRSLDEPLHADEYIPKPFSVAELSSRVERLLRQRALSLSLAHKDALLHRYRLLLQALESLSLDALDGLPSGHALRTSRLAPALARALSLSPDAQERTRLAALLLPLRTHFDPRSLLSLDTESLLLDAADAFLRLRYDGSSLLDAFHEISRRGLLRELQSDLLRPVFLAEGDAEQGAI